MSLKKRFMMAADTTTGLVAPLSEFTQEVGDKVGLSCNTKTGVAGGRVPIGTQRLRLEKLPGTKLVLCFHPSGHHSVLTAQPDPKAKPILLFTDCPS